MKRTWLILLFTALTPTPVFAAYTNSNSLLLGTKAAGLGGAYTALYGDSAASSFYNPASIGRMEGQQLSATVALYNKYATEYGEGSDLVDSTLRVNRGFFRSLPAASGSVISFGTFSLGLSILLADYDFFSGEIHSSEDTTTTLNSVDESLWFGGNLAVNLTGRDTLGLTVYYTARNYLRNSTDQFSEDGTSATIHLEEKSLNHNSLVYILGYWRRLSSRWTMGVSYRFPSLPVYGSAGFFRSTIETDPYTRTVTNHKRLDAETRIPSLLRVGFAYQPTEKWLYSIDITRSGPEDYKDLGDHPGTEWVRLKETFNFHAGMELQLREWLSWRLGIFTNRSMTNPPPASRGFLSGDHVDMWGFSSNIGLQTSTNVQFHFGGYLTEGDGDSLQRSGQRVLSIPKQVQVFSLLLGSSYSF